MSLTLEKLNEDLKILQGRKEEAAQNYHQITGAVSIMEQMIFRLNNPEITPTAAVIPAEDTIE